MIRNRAQTGPHRASWSALFLLVVAACGGGAEAPVADDAWRGNVTTEGAVTTVVNESGQVWESSRLVEELSIGMLDGPDEYVFADIRTMALDDERIYVLDRAAALIRVFDRAGQHQFDIGGPGDGPGEFRAPLGIGLSPDGSRLFVRDILHRRVSEFSRADGSLIVDWPAPGAGQTVMRPDGGSWVYTRTDEQTPSGLFVFAMVHQTADGPVETVTFPPPPEPVFVTSDRRGLERSVAQARSRGLFAAHLVPYAPQRAWAFSPDGELVLGEADDYSFWRRTSDGAETRIRRETPPVEFQPGESDWYRDRLVAFWTEFQPGFVWENEMPAAKRAYARIYLDSAGRAWLLREVVGEPIADCDTSPEDLDGYMERPCWWQPHVYDVFDVDGRFLGPVAVPSEWRVDIAPYINGDEILAVAEDDAGAIMVKHYRLVTE